MPQDVAPGQPASGGPPDPAGTPAAPAGSDWPARSMEDTDTGWGEPPGPDDNERLNRDRPPHWDSV